MSLQDQKNMSAMSSGGVITPSLAEATTPEPKMATKEELIALLNKDVKADPVPMSDRVNDMTADEKFGAQALQIAGKSNEDIRASLLSDRKDKLITALEAKPSVVSTIPKPSADNPNPIISIDQARALMDEAGVDRNNVEQKRLFVNNLGVAGYMIKDVTDTADGRHKAGVDVKIEALDQILQENQKLRDHMDLPANVITKSQLEFVLGKYNNGKTPVETQQDLIGEIARRGISLTDDAYDAVKNIKGLGLNDQALKAIGVKRYEDDLSTSMIEGIKSFFGGAKDVSLDIGKKLLETPSYALSAIPIFGTAVNAAKGVKDLVAGEEPLKQSGQLDRITTNLLQVANSIPGIGDEQTAQALALDEAAANRTIAGTESGVSTASDVAQTWRNIGADAVPQAAAAVATGVGSVIEWLGAKVASTATKAALDTVIQEAVSKGEIPDTMKEWATGMVLNMLGRMSPNISTTGENLIKENAGLASKIVTGTDKVSGHQASAVSRMIDKGVIESADPEVLASKLKSLADSVDPTKIAADNKERVAQGLPAITRQERVLKLSETMGTPSAKGISGESLAESNIKDLASKEFVNEGIKNTAISDAGRKAGDLFMSVFSKTPAWILAKKLKLGDAVGEWVSNLNATAGGIKANEPINMDVVKKIFENKDMIRALESADSPQNARDIVHAALNVAKDSGLIGNVEKNLANEALPSTETTPTK